MESESDTSTIICEGKEGNLSGSEGSSDDVVCVENSNVYNPSIYDQCQASQSSVKAEEAEEEDISHTVSILKIRIHGRVKRNIRDITIMNSLLNFYRRKYQNINNTYIFRTGGRGG